MGKMKSGRSVNQVLALIGKIECCLEGEWRWLGVRWNRAFRPLRPSKGHRGELGRQLLVAAQNVVLIPEAGRGGRMAVPMHEIPQRSAGLRGHRRRRVMQIMPAQVLRRGSYDQSECFPHHGRDLRASRGRDRRPPDAEEPLHGTSWSTSSHEERMMSAILRGGAGTGN